MSNPEHTETIETTEVVESSVPRSRKRGSAGIVVVAIAAVALLITACQPTTPRQAVQARWGNNFACADRVIQRESRWQPTAVSPGGGNIGLFQLNAYHKTWIRNELGYSWDDLKDPAKNAHAAKVLSDKAYRQYRDGWQPWRLDGKARPGGGCPA